MFIIGHVRKGLVMMIFPSHNYIQYINGSLYKPSSSFRAALNVGYIAQLCAPIIAYPRTRLITLH